MRISDLVRAMEDIAPARLAEPWDNVGLVVGDPEAPLGRVLVAIDLAPAVMEEAARHECTAVVAYHPPVFQAQKRFVAGDLGYEAARRGLSVYSPHTALDVAHGGTNDALADALGLFDREALRARVTEDPGGPGIGRIGRVPAATFDAFVAHVKTALAIDHVLLAGTRDHAITRVAVCAGAGGSLVGDAIARGADVYVAGELGHHDALRAARAGLACIATLHSNTERLAMPRVAARLREALANVEVRVSAVDADPFRIA